MLSKPRTQSGQYLKTDNPKTERMRLTKEEKDIILAFRSGSLTIQKKEKTLHEKIYEKALEIAKRNEIEGKHAIIDYIGVVSLKTQELMPYFRQNELEKIVKLKEAMWEADRSSRTAKYFYSIVPYDQRRY